MLQECLTSDYQRKFTLENFRKESALNVAKRIATKIPLKPHLKISIFQLTPGSRLHRIEQRGVASSKTEQLSMKQRQSAAERKRKECKERAKGSTSESLEYSFTCSICN